MKLYSRKHHRNVERQIHFATGKGVRTVCGLTLYSRHVMVSIHSNNDGAVITDDLRRVTCKRCLVTKETRLRKLIALEVAMPGVLDRPTLCGTDWILKHALDITHEDIDSLELVLIGEKVITITNKMRVKDRKLILKNYIKELIA